MQQIDNILITDYFPQLSMTLITEQSLLIDRFVCLNNEDVKLNITLEADSPPD